MKVIAINGSPRKTGNSAAMLDAAIKGALENGAVIERIDLFDLDYKGCVSCFGCKLLGQTEYVTALDTMQFDDYSKYASEMFDGAAKKLRRETVFPEECAKAYEMAKRLTT